LYLLKKAGVLYYLKVLLLNWNMDDQELREKIQQVWSDHNSCEILLTRYNLKQLIETLLEVFEESLKSSESNSISLHFLGLGDSNSAFIKGIKVTRLHTLYKFSLSEPAQDHTTISPQEIEKLVLDFDEKIEDIVGAIVQG
jgi:hypothetical protein